MCHVCRAPAGLVWGGLPPFLIHPHSSLARPHSSLTLPIRVVDSSFSGLPLYGLVVAFITLMSALVVSTLLAVYEMAATAMLIIVLEDWDASKEGKPSRMETALPDGQLAKVFPVTQKYEKPKKKKRKRKKAAAAAAAASAEGGGDATPAGGGTGLFVEESPSPAEGDVEGETAI